MTDTEIAIEEMWLDWGMANVESWDDEKREKALKEQFTKDLRQLIANEMDKIVDGLYGDEGDLSAIKQRINKYKEGGE